MRRIIGIGVSIAWVSIALTGCDVGALPGTEEPDAGIPSSADGLPAGASRLQLGVTTTPTGGQYAPRNVVAVWIEDQAGAFVKTIDRWANVRKQHLVAWTIAAGANDADAVSGATRQDHATPLAITWDLTDRAGVVVPDGTYTVRMESTDLNANQAAQNNQGTFTFVKGPAPDTQTGLSSGGFVDVSIQFTP
jgi:hypothetical protein